MPSTFLCILIIGALQLASMCSLNAELTPCLASLGDELLPSDALHRGTGSDNLTSTLVGPKLIFKDHQYAEHMFGAQKVGAAPQKGLQ